MARNRHRRHWFAVVGVITLSLLAIVAAILLSSPPVERESADQEEKALTGLEGFSLVEAFTPTPDCPERYPQFESVSLSEVVDVVNRCTNSMIVIDDDVLNQARMSGLFDVTDIESFLHLLEVSQWAKAHEQDDGTILLQSIDQP